jgi:choline dehydrogenase-like flavoprotein
MADDQHYEVVIIGTGAGGGTLGHRLATNGAKVLWLERGPFLPRERDNWQADPAASALDVNCNAHDVDNLYVVDTSFFPSIGAVNPSLTAIANALRVGDHITERLA